jgi:hypothetical protein
MKSVILVYVIICLISCKKYVVDVNIDYEGEWHSMPVANSSGDETEIYFIIDGTQGELGEWCELSPLGSNCSSYYTGEANINRKEKNITIGKPFDGIGRIILDIDVPPHINSNGYWECTITERIYIRN